MRNLGLVWDFCWGHGRRRADIYGPSSTATRENGHHQPGDGDGNPPRRPARSSSKSDLHTTITRNGGTNYQPWATAAIHPMGINESSASRGGGDHPWGRHTPRLLFDRAQPGSRFGFLARTMGLLADFPGKRARDWWFGSIL